MAAKRTRKTIGDNPLDNVSHSNSSDTDVLASPLSATSSSESVAKTPAAARAAGRSGASSKSSKPKTTPARQSKAKPVASSQTDAETTDQTTDQTADQTKNAGSDSEPADQSTEPTTAEALFQRECGSHERFSPQRAVQVALPVNHRRPQAMAIVKRWSQWSVAAGVVPVPLLDTVAISGVQLKMVHDLCGFYVVKFEKEAAIGIIASLVGGAVTTSLTAAVTHAFLKTVPFAEQVFQPTLAFATTYSLGYVFVKHFEEHGTLFDFKSDATRVYFREQLERTKSTFRSRKAASN